jgi:hypothetical protein
LSVGSVAYAISIAKHYGFDGWRIDYEDERPALGPPTRTRTSTTIGGDTPPVNTK